MGYDGYSNVGDMELSNFWKKQMKKGAQIDDLKSRIKSDMIDSDLLFKTYLEHANATVSIPDDHQQILSSIETLFDGKAKQALTDRFADNFAKIVRANMEFDLFKDSFNK